MRRALRPIGQNLTPVSDPRHARRTTIVAVTAALTLVGAVAVGCGGEDPPRETVIAQACSPDNTGKRVIVEGFLRLPKKLELSDTAVIDLFSLLGGDGDRASVRVPIGDGPNQLRDLPPTYTPTSLRVGIDGSTEGEEVTIIDRVRLTAKVEDVDGACVLTDPVVEVGAK